MKKTAKTAKENNQNRAAASLTDEQYIYRHASKAINSVVKDKDLSNSLGEWASHAMDSFDPEEKKHVVGYTDLGESIGRAFGEEYQNLGFAIGYGASILKIFRGKKHGKEKAGNDRSA